MPVAAPNPHANFARRKRYDQAVLADNPTHYWKLNEKSGTLYRVGEFIAGSFDPA